MKVLNIGSLNVDKTYLVDDFVKPGETIVAKELVVNFGGKGVNQSIALAKAKVEIYHAGLIGENDDSLKVFLEDNGVLTDYLKAKGSESGHAIIQVNSHGDNSIIILGASNQLIDEEFVDEVLSDFDKGDYLLLQNEISSMPYILTKAKEKGMIIVFNPSPITEPLMNYPIENADYLILNEIEGAALSDKNEYEDILKQLGRQYPETTVVLTVGEKGAYCIENNNIIRQDAFKVPVADTTAAGDTFTGFFIGSIIKGNDIQKSLRIAAGASALKITKKGSAMSIPVWEEVIRFIEEGEEK